MPSDAAALRDQVSGSGLAGIAQTLVVPKHRCKRRLEDFQEQKVEILAYNAAK